MPRGRTRSNIGRRTRHNRNVRFGRESRTAEQRSQDNENTRNQMAQLRTQESQEQRNQRLQADILRHRQSRQRVTDANRQLNRQRMQIQRALTRSSFNRLAFEYDPEIEYSSHSKIIIGEMDKECEYCHAFKFKNETAGMCCASGKVVLPTLNPPPEPLKTLISGVTTESKLFLKKIRKFNSCFQMTSFGATNIVQNTSNDGRNVETTFKIQGQIYHQIGSLLPMPDEDPKFLQIYFMGDEEEQVNIRCNYNHIEENEEKAIVASLETFLNEKTS